MAEYLSDFDDVDDNFEYDGGPYRFRARAYGWRAPGKDDAAAHVDDIIIPLDARVESPR